MSKRQSRYCWLLAFTAAVEATVLLALVSLEKHQMFVCVPGDMFGCGSVFYGIAGVLNGPVFALFPDTPVVVYRGYPKFAELGFGKVLIAVLFWFWIGSRIDRRASVPLETRRPRAAVTLYFVAFLFSLLSLLAFSVRTQPTHLLWPRLPDLYSLTQWPHLIRIFGWWDFLYGLGDYLLCCGEILWSLALLLYFGRKLVVLRRVPLYRTHGLVPPAIINAKSPSRS